MARVALKAGAEVDFLSPEEHRKDLIEQAHLFMELTRGEAGETMLHSGSNFTTDSTGGTSTGPYNGYAVYRVPAGYDAFVTRVTFDFEGSNASSTTSCDIRLCADYNTPSSLRAIYNAVPSVYEASKSHAPMFRGGQLVVVSMTGGPHNTEMYISTQLLLIPRRHTEIDVLGE